VLAVVITANLISAIPRAKLKPEEVADPELWRSDLEMWERLLGGALTYEQLRGIAVGSAQGWQTFVDGLRWPFHLFFDLTHTNQQWGLFAVVAERPERLVIEVRRNGEWERVYRRLDPAYTWHEEQLKYRRIRGVWDSVKDPPKGTYKRFTMWIARTMFTEEPDVDRVRVQLEKEVLTLPWEEPDPTLTYRAEKYHRREVLMGKEEPEEPDVADPPAPPGEEE
jgi:hypothetical protein